MGMIQERFRKSRVKEEGYLPKSKRLCLVGCMRVNVDTLVKRCKTQDFFDPGVCEAARLILTGGVAQ